MTTKRKRAVATKSQQKRTPQRAHGVWRKAFLTQLSVNGNVSAACDAARVERSTVYDARKNDPAFSKQWDDAITTAVDDLEAEAWRRASVGTLKPVWFKGELVGYDLEHSDALMQTLLKGHRPEKYRETLRIDLPPDVAKLLPQLLAALDKLNLPAADVFQEMINQAANADAERING